MGKLFGTDGIRGKAGQYPLIQPLISSLGHNLIRLLQRQVSRPRVIIGWDTRESSPWLAQTIAQAASREGAEVCLAGVLPTSAISYLTKKHQFQTGVMISASHNPYDDNGIKIFQPDGVKLADHQEEELETLLLSASEYPEPERTSFSLVRESEDLKKVEIKTAKPVGWSQRLESYPGPSGLAAEIEPDFSYRRDYVDFLRRLFPRSESGKGIKMVVDCANGASSGIAPSLFEELGFKIVAMNTQPNGKNINANCGALYPQALAAHVKAEGANLGVAFDGDADRAIFVDEKSKILNGDYTLYILANFLQQRNQLALPVVVGTIMSNMGLEVALSGLGLKLVRTRVGDRYVLEEMLRSGANLGGERSGHTILLDLFPTGDGLLTTLKIIEAMLLTGKKLSELAAGLIEFPQYLLNVPVKRRVDFSLLPGWEKIISYFREKLGPYGRIEVRYSGTEPVVRVMAEAKEEELVRESAEAIAQFIQNNLGGE